MFVFTGEAIFGHGCLGQAKNLATQLELGQRTRMAIGRAS